MLRLVSQLFFDDTTDKVYLSTTARLYQPDLPRYGFDTAPWISEVDLESGRLLTLPKLLRQSPIGIGIAEGSHIFRRDDYYYLITAEGGTETIHQQWVFRSKSGPEGPWETGPEGTVNPMVFNGEDEFVQQTGHVDLVQGHGGAWWAVMLGFRNQRHPETGDKLWSVLGRETFLCSVEWEDGWPILNGRKKIGLTGEVPEGLGLSRLSSKISWRDDFNTGQ
jgi:beta-xylosidase